MSKLIDPLATRHLQPRRKRRSGLARVQLPSVIFRPPRRDAAWRIGCRSADGLANSLEELAGSARRGGSLGPHVHGLQWHRRSGTSRNRIRAGDLGELVLTRPGAIVQKALQIVGLDAWIIDWSPDWDE